MGIKEIIGLMLLKQVAIATKNVCAVGASTTVNAIGKEVWGQGAQIADQIAQAAGKGLTAASGEFTALQVYEGVVMADEKSFASWVVTLPAPTP